MLEEWEMFLQRGTHFACFDTFFEFICELRHLEEDFNVGMTALIVPELLVYVLVDDICELGTFLWLSLPPLSI